MNQQKYTDWMTLATEQQFRDVLTGIGLLGDLANVEKRSHPIDGYPVLLANLSRLDSGAPPGMNAAMSLADSNGRWVPFILVPPAKMTDTTFRHECFHISQFFGDAQLRAFFIAAQQVPPEEPTDVAAYAAAQFEGRASAEVLAYLGANGYERPRAVFVALAGAMRQLTFIVMDGLNMREDFIDLAETDLLKAADRVSRLAAYSGCDVREFVRRDLQRIRTGVSGSWCLGDLGNNEVNRWIAANVG